MLHTIKQSLYNILNTTLHYKVVDYAYDENSNISYPFVRLELLNVTRDEYKNCFQNRYSFTIHIFSNYNGEKEIYDMENEIFENINILYNIDGITYIRENGFRIIDDKSTGLVRKHGIITLQIISAGTYQNSEEEA